MKPERYKQIEELYHAALGHKPEERAAFIEQACTSDEGLRREVESLLGYDDRAAEFIETPPDDVAAAMLAAEQKQSMIGRTMGHYRVVSLLGSGGMGEVYLAEDTRLNRRVAMKLLPVGFTADRERLRRFEQEARAASALNHPNIITIHEIGHVDNLNFIVTEFIEGQTLRQLIANARMKLTSVLDVAMQVASALAAAHSAGIVHRDLKPENIMLRPDGLIKVLDFGLAKLTETKAPSADSQAATAARFSTEAGMVLGTARYMSPEQARGLKVDARTDIFSLGVVLYEMLASRPPFAGETTADIISVLLHKDPQPLSRLAPDLPTELQHIVSKALRKDREERYQSIKSLLADLKALKQELDFADKLERSGDPDSKVAAAQNEAQAAAGKTGLQDANTRTGTARQTSSSEYLASRIKQHRVGFGAGLAVLLLAAIGFGYWLYNGRASNLAQIESIAVLPFLNESGNPDLEYLSDGMTESLINSLSQLPKLAVKGRSSVFRYKGKEVEPQQVASALSVQAILNGRVVQRGDDLTLYLSLIDGRNDNQLWGEQYNRKLTDLVALQKEIARDVSRKLWARLSGADEQRLARNYTDDFEAYRLYLKGRYHLLKNTRSEIQTSISYFRQAIEVDPSYALAYAGLADAHRGLALSGEMPPTESVPQAKAAARKAVEIDDRLAEAHAVLGLVSFWYDWDWEAAENQLKRALQLDPNSADAHAGYATLLSYTGRPAEAITEIKRARELDPLNLRTSVIEGVTLINAGRASEALDRLQKALELEPNYWFAQQYAASAYIEKGMFDEAIAESRKAREFPGVPTRPTAFLGYALAKSGRRTEARRELEGLLKLSQERYVSAYSIATIYNGLGERVEALQWLERGYRERDPRMVYLKVEPKWNNLRADPRFQDLLRRVGF